MLDDPSRTGTTAAVAQPEDELRRLVREEVDRALARDQATRRAAFIASKGTLDWAYPSLILSTREPARAWSSIRLTTSGRSSTCWRLRISGST